MSSLNRSLAPASHGFAAQAANALGDVAKALVVLVRALIHRREVTRLLDLDERSLKDIGLVRNDVLGALAEPMSRDPSIVLRLRSVDNRVRERAYQLAARRGSSDWL